MTPAWTRSRTALATPRSRVQTEAPRPYRDRFASGVYAGKIEGIMIGLVVIFVLLGFVLQLGMG